MTAGIGTLVIQLLHRTDGLIVNVSCEQYRESRWHRGVQVDRCVVAIVLSSFNVVAGVDVQSSVFGSGDGTPCGAEKRE